MKKILTVALVALLAAGTAFAGFSGKASLGFGYNFDDKTFGFMDKATKVAVATELTTLSGEKKGEGDVYASIKGSFGIGFKTNENKVDAANPLVFVFVGEPINKDKEARLYAYAKIDEAKVIGENWYVSLLGLPGTPDYAKSAIDTWKEKGTDDYGVEKLEETKNASFKSSYDKKDATGVEVGLAGYTVGAGFNGKVDNNVNVAVYAATPMLDLAEGVKAQVAGVYSYKKASAVTKNALGLSVKGSVAMDSFTVDLASDLGYDVAAKKFGADVAAKAVVSPVTVDAYYATKAVVDKEGTEIENLLSAQVKVDLKDFDVPVALTVTGKDLINKQDLGAKAEVTIDAAKITVSGGYAIQTKVWNAGLEGQYDAEKFTAKAAASLKNNAGTQDLVLAASASVESKVIIPGATVKLAWADAKDLLDKTADTNYGKITLSCEMAF